MAILKPLVIINGVLQELPSADQAAVILPCSNGKRYQVTLVIDPDSDPAAPVFMFDYQEVT